MTNWVIPCNMADYDIVGAFKRLKRIDWRQSANVEEGSYVYIYAGAPISAIKFKCKAIAVNKTEVTINDSEFVLKKETSENKKKYMCLELVEEYSDDLYPKDIVMANGLNTIQGPSKVTEALEKFLSQDFNAKKYTVTQAVWIATALMACEEYENNLNVTRQDMYFKNSEIVKRAQTLTKDRVENARVSWWCCADAKQHTYNFLRGDNEENESLRRLSCLFEFPTKTMPDDLNEDDLLKMNGRVFTMEELILFVREQYPDIIKKSESLKKEAQKEAEQNLGEGGRFEKMKNAAVFDANMILYGPPGTGKTYYTVIYAVAIADNRPFLEVELEAKANYQKVLDRYNELKKEERIAFTTFHQSYGYEEFIEGIKPIVDDSREEVGYTIEDGVFKAFCKKAEIPASENIDYSANVWKITLKQPGDSELKKECFAKSIIKFDWKRLEECTGTMEYYFASQFVDKLKVGDIVVSYYGSSTDIDGVAIVTGDAEYDEAKPSFRWKRTVKWIYQGKPINIRELNGNKYFSGDQIYCLKRIKISELLKLIKPQSYQSNDKNYVFIIDEINRGNISKIFGELITLIEETKRKDAKEEMSAILPYSAEPFSVPNNVYILGTMNTADRSIALMDTALRRRFQFVEMMPNPKVLYDIGANVVIDNGQTLDVAKMLEIINKRIEYLYDREHTIGHAFFTKLKDEPTVERLGSIFRKSVVPLLQEYFYEDYDKIQLILGDNEKEDKLKFVKDMPVEEDIFNGYVSDIAGLPEVKYEIQTSAFTNLQSYKNIHRSL